MSGFMSKIFGSNNQQTNTSTQGQPSQAQPQQGQPVSPGNLPTQDPAQTGPVKSPEQQAPGTSTDATQQQQSNQNSPLDNFKDLWNPVKQDDKNTTPEPNANILDPKKLQEIVAKSNFTNNISQDTLAAINQGGPDAVQAFNESLNLVAQNVITQALLASDKMSEQRVKIALEQQAKQIPDLIRSQTINNSVSESNPNFNHPAVAPLTSMLTKQLAIQFPESSTQEVTKMANDFIVNLAQVFNPNQTQTQQQQNQIPGDNEDWDKFLSGN